MPGVAEYAQQDSFLIPVPPPPPGAAVSGTGAGFPILPILGVAAAGALVYFIFV